MDMTGERFGKWTVINMTKIYRATKNRTACVVRCDCGVEEVREPDRLRNGRTTACRSCSLTGKSSQPLPQIRKPPGYAAITNRMGQYRRSAEKKGLEYELSRELFEELILSDCSYCGDKPTTRLKSSWDEVYVNGIDRIDSSLGYVDGNVVTACWVCNSAKKNMSQQDFIAWVRRVYAKSASL